MYDSDDDEGCGSDTNSLSSDEDNIIIIKDPFSLSKSKLKDELQQPKEMISASTF